jgi:hypothetical protein
MIMHVVSVRTSARMRMPPPLSPAGRRWGGAINGATSSDASFQLFILSAKIWCNLLLRIWKSVCTMEMSIVEAGSDQSNPRLKQPRHTQPSGRPPKSKHCCVPSRQQEPEPTADLTRGAQRKVCVSGSMHPALVGDHLHLPSKLQPDSQRLCMVMYAICDVGHTCHALLVGPHSEGGCALPHVEIALTCTELTLDILTCLWSRL